MLSAAQLLDELMGRDRNLAPDEKRANVRWDDESVCRYYLCGFCPAELFTNTRSDLGPCEKIHDENLRKVYEKSSRFMKEGYERDFLRYLQSLLAEVERRIRRGHARLALSQAQQNAGQGPSPSGKNEEKASVLTEKIEDLVAQIEELGSEGRVEEAQGMMKLVEQLKEERELLSSTPSTIESFAAQEKQMEVCEVCGAFLIVGDAQSRVDDHLMGKQHMGYAKIKSTVEELKEKLHRRSEEPPDENPVLKKDREDREREREEREKKRKEEEEKEKEREKEREKEKERERVRERDRDRDRDRERERDRDRRARRSHSNSRHSSRTSDRKRSRSRDRRRSRSRDKDRERKRSRSRDRERRRSKDRSDRKRRSRSRDKRRSRSSERKSHRHRSRSRSRDRDREKERDRERSSKDKDRKTTEEKSSSKKEKRSDSDAAAIKASSEVEAMQTEAAASSPLINGQQLPNSEGDTQSN
ncbi:luc7-like protein 3 [Gouania willdenowi]|uniref:Luc7-like protein 3 n=1 Tax=Gouania willdenowi TaxID=441366 RepID=A0A8C5E8F5_GOUWI|nr:luc7-like protein 3 [Gouania willdenowi]XP_028311452.1 luc7-like protein 3 [Gouania willdenowi]